MQANAYVFKRVFVVRVCVHVCSYVFERDSVCRYVQVCLFVCVCSPVAASPMTRVDRPRFLPPARPRRKQTDVQRKACVAGVVLSA